MLTLKELSQLHTAITSMDRIVSKEQCYVPMESVLSLLGRYCEAEVEFTFTKTPTPEGRILIRSLLNSPPKGEKKDGA